MAGIKGEKGLSGQVEVPKLEEPASILSVLSRGMWNVKGELFNEAERTKVAKVLQKQYLGVGLKLKGIC